MKHGRFFAVDPSLTCSGWALFDFQDETLLAVGKVKSLPASEPISGRFEDLQTKIAHIYASLSLGKDDFVVCEAPTTMRDPRAALLVEQVRSIFETLARDRGASVPGRIHPRSVQYEVVGLRGKQLKREVVKSSALEVVSRLYGDALERIGFESSRSHLKKHQDVVDAVLIGAYGLSRISQAAATGQPFEEFFSSTQTLRSRS
ncbi:MAG: hypothetical protein KDD55_03015 [Bdellovibrionales bacterium]|nr:hypothetical protein [Bdellovibrionales bacterium]